MLTIVFPCLTCGHQIHALESQGGTRSKCPRCQAKVEVTARSGAAPVPVTKNLVACRDCGNQVSRSAKACPKCGRSIRRETVGSLLGFVLKMIVVILLVPMVCFVLVCGFISALSPGRDAPRPEVATVPLREAEEVIGLDQGQAPPLPAAPDRPEDRVMVIGLAEGRSIPPYFPAAINEQVLRSFTLAVVTADESVQRAMVESNDVFPVELGTRVLPIESALYMERVRILEGKHAGRLAWIAKEYVVPSPASMSAGPGSPAPPPSPNDVLRVPIGPATRS